MKLGVCALCLILSASAMASPANMNRRASGLDALVELFRATPEILKSLGIETAESRKLEKLRLDLDTDLKDDEGALIRLVFWRDLVAGETFPVALHLMAPAKTPMDSLRAGRLHGKPTFERSPEYPYREEAEASEFYWCTRSPDKTIRCDPLPSGQLMVAKYKEEIHSQLEKLNKAKERELAIAKEAERIRRERQRAVAEYAEAVKANKVFWLKEKERVARIRRQEALSAQLRHQLDMLLANSSLPQPAIPGGFTPQNPNPPQSKESVTEATMSHSRQKATKARIRREWEEESDVIILGPLN